METAMIVCANLMIIIALQSCRETAPPQPDRRLNITLQDLLTSTELSALDGLPVEPSAPYLKFQVENKDPDTLYIWGKKLEAEHWADIYYPFESVEYSYFDSSRMERRYGGGAGFNAGLSQIALAPGSSHLGYCYSHADYLTDTLTCVFAYQRDTIRDPERLCRISMTYILKDREVIANLSYEDACAPKRDSLHKEQ